MFNQLKYGHRVWPMFELKSGTAMAAPAAPMPPPLNSSCKCMEALQMCAAYKKPYFLLQVTRESVSVLQVTCESMSGSISHVNCLWTSNGLYDKITIVPCYTVTCLLPLATLFVVCTCNNTDVNKVVIVSSVALYYGDSYIVTCVYLLTRAHKNRQLE